MEKISSKLIVLLILSSLAPLLLFGIISILSSRNTAYKSISEGNLNVAVRAAEQIDLYATNGVRILNAIAQNINRTNLNDWQKETIIKNYVNNFAEFESIYVTDKKGKEIVTSELDTASSPPALKSPSFPPLKKGDEGGLKGDRGDFAEAFLTVSKGEIYKSEVFVSDNLIPLMTIAVPVIRLNEFEGMIAGEINLTNMWRLVDSIRIGKNGFAFVVSKSGLLIAHGDSSSKVRVIQEENIMDMNIVKSVLRGESTVSLYKDYRGIDMLGVSSPIKSVGWGIIIEQPVAEAYAPATRLSYELTAMVILFLIVIAAIGYSGGNRYILTPIASLMEGTREIAQGIFGGKVKINTGDEFSELAKSFNYMSDKLIELQEDIRRKEREATIGKIASGIAHDLKHPVRSIENNSKLISRLYSDEEYRKTFDNIMERELGNINRFLDDLHELSSPKPLEFVPVNPENLINNVIESVSVEAKNNNVEIVKTPSPLAGEGGGEGIKVSADKFALERVFKNIVMNAIQAMPDGGSLTIDCHCDTESSSGEAISFLEISFQDTGIGIPPETLKTIFEDYKTTKKKGLGLGLAISKKIISQHNGTIDVESTPQKGTAFTIKLPII
ncbi:MAG: HAMP domain-containing protein [Nitrospinae bacterium]|nr:HAMP domain-containing protein [Nitrospinota bacterium]